MTKGYQRMFLREASKLRTFTVTTNQNLFPQQTSTNHHLPARFRKKPPSPFWRKSRTKALFILFAQFNLLFWRSCTRCVFERPPMHETVCYQWVRSAPCKTVSHLSRTMLGSDGRALELRCQRFCMVLWCSCVLWWFCCFATLCLQSALEWLRPCCCCGCKPSSCLALKLKYNIARVLERLLCAVELLLHQGDFVCLCPGAIALQSMVAWGSLLHRCCFLTNFRLLALRIFKIPLSNASKPHFLGEASGSGSWNCSVHVCWCYWRAIWWVRSAVELLGQGDFGFASVCWCYCVSQSSCCCIQTAASRLCEMDVKRQKRCQENYIMREMSRDRDVTWKKCQERERGKKKLIEKVHKSLQEKEMWREWDQ